MLERLINSYFDGNGSLDGQAQAIGSFSSFSDTDEIMLWHYRLGHPSFKYLNKLFPLLFKNKNTLNFKNKNTLLFFTP